jgi:hypothetical protein
VIDADDLALLAKSFAAAMEPGRDAVDVDAALHDLGWPDLLDLAPARGAAAAFALLGSTGSAATLLDDVLAAALGAPVAATTCVVLPRPHAWEPPGHLADGRVAVDGLVSARVEVAERTLVVTVAEDGTLGLADVDPMALLTPAHGALDPSRPFRRAQLDTSELRATTPIEADVWTAAVRAGRVALAHQLVGASRHMLELARSHAIDRAQFGRPIASFQAVRHKLAECLVAIEAAAGVAAAADEQGDDLSAAVAKSMAGKAARTTATHAQQVLAGIGFTTEHPFHLYLKRTMVLDTLLGSARTLPSEIGRTLVGLRTAPRLIEL